MRYTYLAVTILACFLPTLLLANEEPSSSKGATISVVRDKIVVPVLVNGIGPYPFILDAGIEHTVVSETVAGTLGQSTQTAATAQGSPADVEIGELRCGEFASKPLRAIVMDLSGFMSTLALDVGGILSGREFGGRVDINLALQTIEFFQQSPDAPGAADSRSIRLRQDERGNPLVSGTLDGRYVRSFILDTTFGGIVGVPEQVLRDLGLFSRSVSGAGDVASLRVEPSPEGSQGSLPAPPESMLVRLKTIRVGSVEIAEPVCSVLSSGEPARIGLGFLRSVKACMDFDAKFLRFEHKGAGPIACPPVVGYGLSPARFSDGYWAVWVAKDSPSARAGIRSGALLLDVSGTELKDAPYATVSERLSASEGGTLSVTICQEGEKRTVALAARPLL